MRWNRKVTLSPFKNGFHGISILPSLQVGRFRAALDSGLDSQLRAAVIKDRDTWADLQLCFLVISPAAHTELLSGNPAVNVYLSKRDRLQMQHHCHLIDCLPHGTSAFAFYCCRNTGGLCDRLPQTVYLLLSLSRPGLVSHKKGIKM